MNEITDDLGCAKCLATPDTDTDFDSLPFKKIKTLYDKSDNSFYISECSYCHQPYLEEYRDNGMLGGWDDDPMWSYWMPLKASEVVVLYKVDVPLSEIENIMRKRSFLINESRKKSTFKWAK